MVARSQVAVDRKIIALIPWYRGFSALDFDSHFHIPWHSITLQFLELVVVLLSETWELTLGWVM